MIREKTIPHDIVIDLDGPDGNAFVLLGTAKRFAKQLCYDNTEIDSMLKDMQSSGPSKSITTSCGIVFSLIMLQ